MFLTFWAWFCTWFNQDSVSYFHFVKFGKVFAQLTCCVADTPNSLLNNNGRCVKVFLPDISVGPIGTYLAGISSNSLRKRFRNKCEMMGTSENIHTMLMESALSLSYVAKFEFLYS